MPARKRTILVIQDGSEMVRQSHADSESFFRALAESGFLAQRNLDVRVLSDVDAGLALSAVSTFDCAAVVFASNALIRSDGEIVRALRAAKSTLTDYLQSGGGVLFLHQSFPQNSNSEVDFLPFLGPVTYKHRNGFDSRVDATISGADHPIFRFPNVIAGEQLRELSAGRWRGSFPLYFEALQMREDTGLRPLLAVSGNDHEEGCLIAEADTGGRLVLCTLPLDWGREVHLMENLLSYLVDGIPDVILVDVGGGNSEGVQFALARLRSSLTVYDMQRSAVERVGNTADSARAMSVSGKLLVLHESGSKDFSEIDAVETTLSAGGMVIQWSPSDGKVDEQLYVKLRPQFPRDMCDELSRELGLLFAAGWVRSALIHDIRDVVLASTSLPNGSAAGPDGCARDVLERCAGWVENNSIESDPGTALVVAWLLALYSSSPLCRTIVRTLSGSSCRDSLSPDHELLIELIANHTIAGRTDRIGWERLVEPASLSELSDASAVRILDTLRAAITLGYVPPLEVATVLLDECSRQIGKGTWHADSGWSSVERTAAIVLGLTALSSVLLAAAAPVPQSAREVLADGLVTLTRSRQAGSSRGVTGIVVQEALLRVEVAWPTARGSALVELLQGGRVSGDLERAVAKGAELSASLASTRAALTTAISDSSTLVERLNSANQFRFSALAFGSRAFLFAWLSALFVLAAASIWLVGETVLRLFSGSAERSDLFGSAGAATGAIAIFALTWAGGRQIQLRKIPSVGVDVGNVGGRRDT